MISWPWNVHRPASACSKPVSTLNRVVLPAPFGPMRAMIRPSGTSRCSTSVARRPPNERRTCSATRIGSVTPAGPVSAVMLVSRASPSTSVTSGLLDQRLGAAAEQPLRPEDHQQHEHEPDEREPDRPSFGRTELRPEEAVSQCLLQESVGALEQEPEEHAPHDRADHASDPADDDHGEREEREDRLPVVGIRELGVDGEQDPGERANGASEHEALELEREHVLSEAAGCVLIVADSAEHPTPRAAHEQEDEPRRERNEGPPDEHHPQGAVAEAFERTRAYDEPDNLGRGDRHDGEVLGTQPQRREPENETEDDRGCHADEKGKR